MKSAASPIIIKRNNIIMQYKSKTKNHRYLNNSQSYNSSICDLNGYKTLKNYTLKDKKERLNKRKNDETISIQSKSLNLMLKSTPGELMKKYFFPNNISLKECSTNQKINKFRLNKSSYLLSPRISPFTQHILNIKIDHSQKTQVFSEQEIIALFLEKCKDLNIPVQEELLHRFMSFIKEKCVNRIINLSDFNLGINSISVLSQILNKKNDFYSRIILSKNDLGDYGIKMLMEQIKDNDYIVELNLSSTNIGVKGGDIIFSNLINQNSIISIDLSSKESIYRNRICSEGVRLIENVLKKNVILEKIDLSSNSIKNKGMEYIVNGLKSNMSLQTLILSNNEINQKGISYMESNLDFCKLNYLDLSCNPLSNEGIVLLGNCISGEQLKEIIYLNVSDCGFYFNAFKDLIKKVIKNNKLQTLIVNKNNLFSHRWDILQNIFKISSIQNLSLASCGLGPVISDVATIFTHNQRIKYLDFSHNQINDKGFEKFQDYPINNSSLEVIDFSNNYISDKSAKIFFKNLISNNNIKRLNFNDNQLKNESGFAILEVLKINHSLLSLKLKYNIIGAKILNAINLEIFYNKIYEKGKFIPKLKGEIKELELRPLEIKGLKYKMLVLNKERERLTKRFREDMKKYNMAKKKNQEEVKNVEYSFNQIEKEMENCIKKIHNLNEEINTENILFTHNIEMLEKKINLLQNEIIEIKKIQNINKKRQNDEKIILEDTYNKTLNNEQQLRISISSLSKKLENAKFGREKKQKAGNNKRPSNNLKININQDIASYKTQNNK